jgi:hypothetical protein
MAKTFFLPLSGMKNRNQEVMMINFEKKIAFPILFRLFDPASFASLLNLFITVFMSFVVEHYKESFHHDDGSVNDNPEIHRT